MKALRNPFSLVLGCAGGGLIGYGMTTCAAGGDGWGPAAMGVALLALVFAGLSVSWQLEDAGVIR